MKISPSASIYPLDIKKRYPYSSASKNNSCIGANKYYGSRGKDKAPGWFNDRANTQVHPCGQLNRNIFFSKKIKLPQFKITRGVNAMKVIILTLCFFIALLNFANAEALYNCIDRDGNSIVTDSPQDGMKNCVLKESESVPSSEEPENEKVKTVAGKGIDVVEKKDNTEERNKKIKKCFDCCNEKNYSCYNYTAKGRACYDEGMKCVETCKSEGATPSSWSECWSNAN